MRAIASYLPLLFCALLAAACQRRLPGPEECRSFALASVGVEPGTPATTLSRHPALAERAEEVTRKCLTTPWDYKLLNCFASGGSSRLCLRSFEVRRLSGGR